MNRYREDEARKLRIIAEVKLKHLPCFTVVRNPWSRAVSSWKWCMQEKGLAPCSFEEFLRIPLERMTEQQRFHTLPQWRHVRGRARPHRLSLAPRPAREPGGHA